jgi:hypothetical protein
MLGGEVSDRRTVRLVHHHGVIGKLGEDMPPGSRPARHLRGV